MVRLVFFCLLVSGALSTVVHAEEHYIEYKYTLPLSTGTMVQISEIVREKAMNEASYELPSLIFGSEVVEGDEYTHLLQRHSVGVFDYKVLSEFIDRVSETATFEVRVSFDIEQAIQLLEPVAQGLNAVVRLEGLLKEQRQSDIDAANFSILMLERAKSHVAALNRNAGVPGSDAYLLARRVAQERFLFEVMKDVYVTLMLPALNGFRKLSSIERVIEDSNNGVLSRDGAMTFYSDTPLVEGILQLNSLKRKEAITWRDELEFVLKPYQEVWPFVTVALIEKRMFFCGSDLKKIDPYHIQPVYLRNIWRRREGSLSFILRKNKRDNGVVLRRDMGEIGICIGK